MNPPLTPAAGLFAPERFAGSSVLVAGQDPVCRAFGARLAAGGARVTLAGPSADGPDVIACDGLDAASIASVFDAIGETTLLVIGPAVAAGEEAFRARLAGALDMPFFFAAEFARRRIAAQASGSLLILMSPAMIDAGAGDPAQTAAAHALANLIKTLAVEWARDGLRINGLGLGADLDTAVNLGLYLLSDYGAYMTGQIAIADGPAAHAGLFI